MPDRDGGRGPPTGPRSTFYTDPEALKANLSRYSNPSYKGWIHPDLRISGALLDDLRQIIALPGTEHLLDCTSRQIHRVSFEVGGTSLPCFFYQFTNTSRRRSLGRNPVLRTARMADLFRRNGISSIEVLFALKKRAVLNWESFLLAKEIPAVKELAAKGSHIYRVHPTAPLSAELAILLARDLGRIHDLGFFHGDLKSRHILVSRSGPDGSRFHFVDIERSVYIPSAPALVKDLFASKDLIQLQASVAVESHRIDPFLVFMEHYWRSRKISESRVRRVKGALRLYGPSGLFRQGHTVLENLLHLVERRKRRP